MRLGQLIDQRCIELGLKLAVVAKRAGLSPEALRLIRNGTTTELQSKSKTGLELALQWAPTSIEKILAGGDPMPIDPADTRAAAMPPEGQAGDELSRPGTASPSAVLAHLQVSLELGGADYFWQAMIRMNRLHNPLWVEPIQHRDDDRSA